MPSIILSSLFSYATLGYLAKVIRSRQHQEWLRILPTLTNVSQNDMATTINTVSTVEGAMWPKTLYKYMNDPAFRVNDPEQWSEERRQRLTELCHHSSLLNKEYENVKRLLMD